MNKLSEKLKAGKNLPIIIGVAVGIALLILGALSGGSEGSAAPDSSSYSSPDVTLYTDMLEEKIKKLCESVAGVEKATVLLTLDRGSELIYAQNGSENISDSSYSSATDYLLINRGDNDTPLQLCEIYPKIRGVAVVCTGGDRATVAKTVTELISAALGISTNKIMVAGM